MSEPERSDAAHKIKALQGRGRSAMAVVRDLFDEIHEARGRGVSLAGIIKEIEISEKAAYSAYSRVCAERGVEPAGSTPARRARRKQKS